MNINNFIKNKITMEMNMVEEIIREEILIEMNIEKIEIIKIVNMIEEINIIIEMKSIMIEDIVNIINKDLH